jgi:hypothetical protein
VRSINLNPNTISARVPVHLRRWAHMMAMNVDALGRLPRAVATRCWAFKGAAKVLKRKCLKRFIWAVQYAPNGAGSFQLNQP